MDSAAFSEQAVQSRGSSYGAVLALLVVAAGLWLLFPWPANAEEKAETKAATYTMDEGVAKDWLARWDKSVSKSKRYCDSEMGEELGWLITPYLNGFYYGYMATKDPKWADMLVDWADSLIKRGVKGPDGFTGWPKAGATGTALTAHLFTDSQLGEAMALRPIVLMADEILKTPALKEKHGRKAEE